MATYYALDAEAQRRRRKGAYDDSAWPDVSVLRIMESTDQHSILAEVTSSLEKLIELRGWTNVLLSGHTFFAWKPDDPDDRIAPDLYLMELAEVPWEKWLWQTWKPDYHRPRWVLEVAADHKWRKDYASPPTYGRLGCSEMVIFDPRLVTEPHRRHDPRRSALTIYRFGPRGEVRRVYSGKGPAYSKELRVWLAATMSWNRPTLRLWFDKNGKRVVPTHAEARELAERRTDEAKRQIAEIRRQTEEIKRATRRRERARRQITESRRRTDEAKRRIAEYNRQADEAKRRTDEYRAECKRMAERLRRAGIDPHYDP